MEDPNQKSDGDEKEEESSGDDADEAPVQLLRKEDLLFPPVLSYLYNDLICHYYAMKDWSVETYVLQAYLGFIAVSFGEEYLLPEIQKTYCVLQFSDLHIPHGVYKRLKTKYSSSYMSLRINTNLQAVLDGINHHHAHNWVNTNYTNLLKKLFELKEIVTINNHKFQFMTVELWMKRRRVQQQSDQINEEKRGMASESDEIEEILVAGEIGYRIGSIYTSLTGFSLSQYPSTGNIQLIALGLSLKQCGFSFWNLGHPPRPNGMMKYKADLGGVILSRKDFLQRWEAHRSHPPSQSSSTNRLAIEDVNSLICKEYKKHK